VILGLISLDKLYNNKRFGSLTTQEKHTRSLSQNLKAEDYYLKFYSRRYCFAYLKIGITTKSEKENIVFSEFLSYD
jgi:hypothetical protein